MVVTKCSFYNIVLLATGCVDQRDKEFFMTLLIPLISVHNYVGRLLNSCSNISIFLQSHSHP